jgi:hypothetical protein
LRTRRLAVAKVKIVRNHFFQAQLDVPAASPAQEMRTHPGFSSIFIMCVFVARCIASPPQAERRLRTAFDLGFRCQVAGDACATRVLHSNGAEVAAAQVQGAFLAALQGVCALVGTAAEMAS